jgi:hypothetical protein
MRIREAARLGYKRVMVPEVGRNRGTGGGRSDGIEVVSVKSVGRAMDELG